MTHIAPCTRCPLSAGCEHRDELRKKARGLGARSVRFNCDILKAEVRRGRRIVIMAPVVQDIRIYDYDDRFDHPYFGKIEVNATIANVRPDYSFQAVIDAGQLPTDGVVDGEYHEELTPEQVNARRFRRMQPHIRIIRFLDEPDRKVCALDNLMLPAGGCETRYGECQCVDVGAAMDAETRR